MLFDNLINDNLIPIFSFIFTILAVYLAWLSTHVREFLYPSTILIIQRRLRQNNTIININNNSNLIQIQNTQTNESYLINLNENEPFNVLNNNNNQRTNNDNIDDLSELSLVDELLNDASFRVDDNQHYQPQQENPINSTIQEVVESQEEVNEPSIISSSDQRPISIYIRLVNEQQKQIQVYPKETILSIKRKHFQDELNTNKIVRFIYQGQFLRDNLTIENYNIHDQTTIHCHITNKTSVDDLNNQSSTINTQTITTNPQVVTQTESHVQQLNVIQTQSSQRNSLLNLQYGMIILPLCTILLSIIWYLRLNFKQFFSPLSNLSLFTITCAYFVFLLVYFYQLISYTRSRSSPRNIS